MSVCISEGKRASLPVHWPIFELQVLHVEDVTVLLVFHYHRPNHHIEVDFLVIDYQHSQVSK